jgi:hypothetical protein
MENNGISPAAVAKNLESILAQMRAAEYESAAENIGSAIEDQLQEIIELGRVREPHSSRYSSIGAITAEHVVLARRFIPRLRAITQMLRRNGGGRHAVTEMERLVSEWSL